jgi:hypothetical protein
VPRPQATLDELLAAERWRRNVRNPELKKALGYVRSVVGEVRRLLALPDELALRTPEIEARLRDTLDQPVRALTIDSAWELYNELKTLLPYLSNADYVAALLDEEAERTKDPMRWHPWSQHYSMEDLQYLRDHYRAGTMDPRLQGQAAAKLSKLYSYRAEAGRERRVKAAQKRRYLIGLAPALFALQVAVAFAIDAAAAGSEEVWKQIFVAGAAGALGATLAGTMKIRDHIGGLDDLRSFWPAVLVQPLVGATAGLIVLLVIETGTLDGAGESGSWAGRALVAFAAGFSEPFFLGLVQRVAVIPDRKEEPGEPLPGKKGETAPAGTS